MKKLYLLSILALGVGIILVNQTSAGVVGDRLHNQKLRIRHGVINGELTRNEARALKREQRRIHHFRMAARADGRITYREQRRLAKMQYRASNHIYRLKHNASRRPWTGGYGDHRKHHPNRPHRRIYR